MSDEFRARFIEWVDRQVARVEVLENAEGNERTYEGRTVVSFEEFILDESQEDPPVEDATREVRVFDVHEEGGRFIGKATAYSRDLAAGWIDATGGPRLAP